MNFINIYLKLFFVLFNYKDNIYQLYIDFNIVIQNLKNKYFTQILNLISKQNFNIFYKIIIIKIV